MGLFDFLKYNSTERALLNHYSQIFSMQLGISSGESKKFAKDVLDSAIVESKEDDTHHLPQNLGDIILGDAVSDDPAVKKLSECIKQKLPTIKKEGVRDEDVRWWWNMSNVERLMPVECEFVYRMKFTSLEIMKEVGLVVAFENIKKNLPIYEEAIHNIGTIQHDDNQLPDYMQVTGDDKPLPRELTNRINIYIEKRIMSNIEKYENDIQQSSSFNALIRREIKAGNL